MKVVCALYEPDRLDRAERRRRLVDEAAPALLGSAQGLTVYVADEEARVRSPSPFPLSGERPVAVVELWTEGDPLDAVRILGDQGFSVHAWPSEASVPTDYGDNEHAGPRDWPDGARSPGLVLVSLLPRPARLDREEWVRRWHGVISPVTGAIQPRTRYVRNLLGPALTPDAPEYEGIVAECWPSARHVTSPWLFYGASTPWGLVYNQLRIVRAVTSCMPLMRIAAVPMSEWILRSDYGKRPLSAE